MPISQLHILVPFYNEEKRFSYFEGPMRDFLIQDHLWLGEIVLINDGSTDRTLEHLERFAKTIPEKLKVVSYGVNQGKGYALQQGMKVLEDGSHVLFVDADLQIPIGQIVQWQEEAWVKHANCIYVGDRELGKQRGWVEYSPLRTFAGKVFVRLVSWMTGLKLRDSQCGFKLFPHIPAKRLFQELQETGFAFDVELLARAKRKGIRIESLAVHCHHVEGSKVRVFRDGWRMFIALWRIRRRIRNS